MYVFETWEREVRGRLATALRLDFGDVTSPYFGDLRHLRNDVVHHGGIASQANTGRCQMIRDWFTIGDPIRLTGAQLRSLVYELFPEADLLAR